jgi:class 3 adenylate cyclase/tetratricopeptide (TPR) repeat protein
VQRIEDVLASLGLSEYVSRFAEQGVDTSALRYLTDQDLKDLGIPLGHRKKLLGAIGELEGTAAYASSLATRSAPGERRQLTVMFCDLAGSTELSARLDAEDLRSVIGAYRAACAQVISAYDGFIAQFLGDGLLVYFGFPHAHENDAERAVRAGLDIVAAIPRLETAAQKQLAARVGIATGVVVVGDLIAEGASEGRAVVGETPNLAARLQTIAKPGTVVLSASTRRLAAGHFEYRDLGAVALKGLGERIAAWQALGPSAVESRFEAEHGINLPPLLGRHEEIELLSRRWRQAEQGEGCVVLLTGEPGIGKSQIALTFQQRLQAEPHIRLRYFCSSHHTNSALFPFISQLERAAGFERSDTTLEKFTKLKTLLAGSPSQAGVLANLLSLPPNDSLRLPEVSPQKRKETTLLALLAVLQDLAAGRPVLVVFEDLHWIDPTSLELLALTIQRLPELRVLLLITARPEFIPPWPNHAHVTTVPLTRLSRRLGTALVERVTTGKQLPEPVMEKILAHTDGVPLFIEELTKTVLESGLLQEQDGRYVLDRPLPSFAIPTTLYASLMARLDRLAAVKEIAQIGATLGREFSYELLNVVAGLPRERLDEALDQLVRSELLFSRGEGMERVYTFKHVLVRDVAYAGLLKNRRAELHAAIANAFEQRFQYIIEAEPETLAHHLTEAGLIRKAVEYWLRAGKKAADRSANIEAIAHLQRGIATASHLPEDTAKDLLEFNLHFALAPCLIATQGPASGPAMATFTRAHELCKRLEDPAEYLQVMFWLVTASVVRGELKQAEEAIGILLRLAKRRDDQAALLNAKRGRAMILLFMGRITDAHEEIERAISQFDASSEPVRLAARAAGQDAGAAALALMSWTFWLLGRADKARVQIAAALERADAVQHPHTQAYVCYYASVLHALRGEFAIALKHAERCIALSEDHGFGQWRSLARAIRGISMTVLDTSSDTLALDEVRGAFNDYRRAGYALGITALDVLWCPALLLQHQPEAALEVIEQGLATAGHNSERIFEAELYRLKARVLLVRSGADARAEAQPLLCQALTTARNQHARSLELRAAKDLAAFWMDQNKHAEATDLLAPIAASFTEGFDTRDLREAKALLGQSR